MRKLKDHIVEGDLPQNQVVIQVTDEPGAGGANHRYEIRGFNNRSNPSANEVDTFHCWVPIVFQNGPIQEAGVNGITQEVLLAIVIDRLRNFQKGPFPSDENSIALIHCGVALDALKSRTRNRLARGVEGQTKK